MLRVCPVCGYEDETHRGKILVVVRDLFGEVVVADCFCPNCYSVWTEYYDKKRDIIENEITLNNVESVRTEDID